MAETYAYIGAYYQSLKLYNEAIKYFYLAFKINEELNNLSENKKVLLSLSEIYFSLSLYKSAYEYFKKYQIANDSLKSESHTKRITQLEMQYEFDKKQKEQQQKEQVLQAKIKTQKVITFSAITLISFLLFLSLLAFRNYRLKQKNIKKDIELQRVEAEKKREMDQMKLHFFANASHDIRTPLTLITGPLQELMDGKETSPQRQKNLELIDRNANLLKRFVDQILDFQKLDSSLMSLTLTQGDIVQTTKKTIEIFGHYLENKKCTLDFHSTHEEINIPYDSEKIEKILYNLIFNAVKFTPKQGKITVKITDDLENIFITVKDSGPGIPKEQIGQIFERYHQVEKNKAFYKGGSGIGLAHAKELIKLHKGEIKVTSVEGEGSEFTMILPRDKNIYQEEIIIQSNINEQKIKSKEGLVTTVKTDTIQLQKNVARSEMHFTDKPSVLIIEDDFDMHEYIVNSLKQNYNIYEAYDGAEGYRQAIEHNPDLIISDVMMEKMDGMELCSKIKTDLQVCHIPVILLTALASVENKITGFETGADDYITKPFDKKLLQVRVQNIIKSRRMLREIFSKNVVIEPQKITTNSLDREFLRKAIDIVEENISDSNFDVDTLCENMNTSRSVFFRKIKSLTDLSSNDFIKNIRLKRAAQLLKANDHSIAQIADEVGFTDQRYFSTCFKKYFGKSPSEYIREEQIG
jgi:signal transduction histidine kinase/DNA-binding response OmpR family regulator